MVWKRHWKVLGGGLVLSLLAVGPITAMATGWRSLRNGPVDLRVAKAETVIPEPWAIPIRTMDTALTAGDPSAAERAWHAAYVADLQARRWEGMLAVGDAALRLGDVIRGPRVAVTQAREAYLAALFRARDRRSLDGVLRSAEAFDRMGDGELADRARSVADILVSKGQVALAAQPDGTRRVQSDTRRHAAIDW
jgi:hypothetical protein